MDLRNLLPAEPHIPPKPTDVDVIARWALTYALDRFGNCTLQDACDALSLQEATRSEVPDGPEQLRLL